MGHGNLPTDAELAILQVLWERRACTVRQVHEALKQRQRTGYTTVLKLMQIMLDKGLVQRDESQRSHIYRPTVSRSRAQRRLISDLLDKAFAGSAASLVMQALSAKPATAQELSEIRAMLDRIEQGETTEGGSR